MIYVNSYKDTSSKAVVSKMKKEKECLRINKKEIQLTPKLSDKI